MHAWNMKSHSTHLDTDTESSHKETGVAYNYVEADGGAHVYQIKFYCTLNVDHNAMLLPQFTK